MAQLKNPKWEAVAQAYIADPERNGPRAYCSVYRKSSQHAAETAIGRLLKKAEFRARIAELEGKAADLAVEEGVMSRLQVLQELSNLGRANMADLVHITVAGDVVEAVKALPREQSAAIAELTVESYEEHDPEGEDDDATRTVKRVKLKISDKRGPLRDLGQHYKLFTERREHTDPDGRPLGTGAAEAAAETISELELARRIAFALERAARKKEGRAR